MTFCMQCGHELGASRTCPGCGTVAPVEPPPAPQLPPAGARYPLFADEVGSVGVSTSGRVLAAPVPEPTRVRLPAVAVVPRRRRGLVVVWLVLAALVLAMLGLGTWLLLRGGASSDREGAAGGAAGTDVAATATATAPVTRPPGVDTRGNRTSYAASNMVDGDPGTAWEMPGDGTGTELVFRLAEPTTLSRVGLVNGYAKTGEQGGRKLDWYAGNRRVLAAEWLFDDGTTVSQELSATRKLQTVAVHATTTTVRLRLVEVSAPGSGPARRDMTAVSEVSLVGTPG